MGMFQIDENLFATKLAFVCGFGSKALPPTGDCTATVITCNIANEQASTVKIIDDAEKEDWKSFEFYLIDKVVDYGFSGAPVLAIDGKVQGMLCKSEYEGYSWCLKAIIILEKLSILYL
jgi:hypothetical protein